MFGFEKLEVWQKAVDYADVIYDLTASFPADERFGLTNQMRRAAVSISSNIAEGSSRGSRRDFARFVEIAYGSLMETVSQAHISHRRQFLTDDALADVTDRADQMARMLSGLKRRLRDEG